LAQRITAHACGENSLNLDGYQGKLDLALTFAMIHEVTDPQRLWTELHQSLRPGAHVLFAEPKGHVSRDAFANSLVVAASAGLRQAGPWEVRRCHGAVLRNEE
jgi:SAM-dependent methyltransferase